MKKTFVIIKIGESLRVQDLQHNQHKTLKTGEPSMFAAQLAEANPGCQVFMYNMSGESTKQNVTVQSVIKAKAKLDPLDWLWKRNYIKHDNGSLIFDLNRDDVLYIEHCHKKKIDLGLDNMSIFLWQGLRTQMFEHNHVYGDIELMIPSYTDFSKLQQIAEKQYFVQTDLRVPLFDLNTSFEANQAKIDMSKLVLLSQARIDYRKDLLQIFEESTRVEMKQWYGTAIYTDFADFQHLELYFVAYDNFKKENIFVKEKSIDILTSTQGYGTMLPETRQQFRQYFCNGNIIEKFNVSMLGRMTDSDRELLLSDLKSTGQPYMLPNFIGFLDWNEIPNISLKSRITFCVTNNAYEKYDLMPNRFVEAIVCESLPVFSNSKAAMQIFDNDSSYRYCQVNNPAELIEIANATKMNANPGDLPYTVADEIIQESAEILKTKRIEYISKLSKL